MIGHNPRIPPFLRPFVSILLLLLIVMAGVTGQNVLRAQAIPDDEAEIAPVLVSETDILLRALILDQGLTGDPSRGRDLPSIDEPLAQLGKALFFTKALGGDMDSACASCHLPTLGGDDARALPIGVGAYEPDLLGPGRAHPEGGSTVPRNSPTTFNVGLWDKFLFHDGRVESLDKIPGANGAGPLGIRTPDSNFGEPDPLAGTTLVMAQSRFPVTSAEEMRGFDLTEGEGRQVLREYLAARIGGYGDAADDLNGRLSLPPSLATVRLTRSSRNRRSHVRSVHMSARRSLWIPRGKPMWKATRRRSPTRPSVVRCSSSRPLNWAAPAAQSAIAATFSQTKIFMC